MLFNNSLDHCSIFYTICEYFFYYVTQRDIILLGLVIWEYIKLIIALLNSVYFYVYLNSAGIYQGPSQWIWLANLPIIQSLNISILDLCILPLMLAIIFFFSSVQIYIVTHPSTCSTTAVTFLLPLFEVFTYSENYIIIILVLLSHISQYMTIQLKILTVLRFDLWYGYHYWIFFLFFL